MLVLLNACSPTDSGDPLNIDTARWQANDHTLTVSGSAKTGIQQRLEIRAKDSQQLIGTASISEDGHWTMESHDASPPCEISVQYADQRHYREVDGAPQDCGVVSNASSTTATAHTVLAANDLGMHCADQDYQIFSILPPFSVVHAQVVARGAEPNILTDEDVDLVYSASSNPDDPAGSSSINTTSQNMAGVFKSNFWQRLGPGDTAPTLGIKAYEPLYPSILAVDPSNPCQLTNSCASVLTLFDTPLPLDLGIPVPDPALLYPETGSSSLVTAGHARAGQYAPAFRSLRPGFAVLCGLSIRQQVAECKLVCSGWYSRAASG